MEAARPDPAALLDAAVNMEFDDYDPWHVIAAVNALLPCGKDGALAAITQCTARHPDSCHYGLFWTLRVLFVVTAVDGGHPVPFLGAPTIPPPANPDTLPQYPIVVVHDVPLLAINGYTLAGSPQPVQQHIDYFRQHGALRSAPLAPPADCSHVEDAFVELWKRAYPQQDRTLAHVLDISIRPQLARCPKSS